MNNIKQIKSEKEVLASKVLLITGASSGIGKACAEYMARKGFIVYGTSRGNTENISSEKVRMLKMDVTDLNSVRIAVQHIISEQGGIDILVNNAGVGIGGALELATQEEIMLQMNTNFMGTVNVCSAVLPYMRSARKGHIINISSLAGVMGIPFQGFYSASKFAIEGYSEALSFEIHKFNIHISLIEPGDFHTGFTANRLISKATKENSDYGIYFEKVMAVAEKEELAGCKPEKIAKLMYRIIMSPHPKFRYKSGNMLQVGFAKATKFIPYRFYQFLLRFFYGIN